MTWPVTLKSKIKLALIKMKNTKQEDQRIRDYNRDVDNL